MRSKTGSRGLYIKLPYSWLFFITVSPVEGKVWHIIDKTDRKYTQLFSVLWTKPLIKDGPKGLVVCIGSVNISITRHYDPSK